MEAAEAKVQRILEGTKQFLVPHFQRPYSWRDKQWETLWRDLIELAESPAGDAHFLGSIVSAPARSVPEGVDKRLLIDGQQRLTTLVLLLALLRDRAAELGEARLADRINDLVVNRHYDDLDRYKLLPTQGDRREDSDREAFAALIDGRDHTTSSSLAAAAAYFRERLRRADAPPIERLFATLTARFTLVSIILDEKDNPHRIFESLNGKGRPLSQADLIRNDFFMRLPASEHERVYQRLWQPMQARLGEDVLTEFIRHYLMREGSVVNEGDVYATLKARLDAPGVDVAVQLENLATHSRYYQVLLEPSLAPSAALRERLGRLARLQVTVAFPFLLPLYARYDRRQLDEGTFSGILDAVETYVIRRFVCGVATSGLNKVFPTLYAQLHPADALLPAVRGVLAQRGCPTDTQFRERLSSGRLYGGGERRERCKFILERLEQALGHKERVDPGTLSIEHVLPQTLSGWWREHLGPEWADDHESLLHTLGNLTLTGYNSELSNDTFPEKRRVLAESHLQLNQYFLTTETWRPEDIEARADALADLALSVWPSLGPASATAAAAGASSTDDVTSTLPRAVTYRGVTHPVRAWVDVLVTTLDALHREAPDAFARVEEELSRVIRRDPSGFRNARRLRRLASGAFVETNQSASSIHRLCLQALQVMGVEPEAWSVERVSLASRDDEDDRSPSELGLVQAELWTAVQAALAQSPLFPSLPRVRPQHAYGLSIGRTGFTLALIAKFTRRCVEVRLLINSDDADEALRRLADDRAAIEREIAVPLEWDFAPEQRRQSIRAHYDVDLQDRRQWPTATQWLARTAAAFKAALGPRIAALDA